MLYFLKRESDHKIVEQCDSELDCDNDGSKGSVALHEPDNDTGVL